MRLANRLRLSLLAFVLVPPCITLAAAQQPRFPLNKLGVDMITVPGGHRLLGALLNKTNDSISFAVEREWLKNTHPKLYEKFLAAENQQRDEAGEMLIRRYDSWKQRRGKDVGLIVYINKRLQELRAANPNATAKHQFMLLRFKSAEVKRQYSQPPQRKQVVLLAWQKRLKGVTTRAVSSLRRELTEQKVTASNTRVDLRRRLPNWSSDERAWAAHVAFVEYRLRQKLNYQGTDNFLVQTGDKAKPADLQQIFMRMLNDELKSKLAQLLEKPAGRGAKDGWKKTAIEGARQAKVSGVRVARLRQNVTTGSIEVNISFLAEMPDGMWQVVYDDTVKTQAAEQDAQRRRRVAVAPEVQKVLEIAKAAGINPGDKKIQLALQHGAAAQEAQSKALRRFADHVTEVVNPR